MATATEGGGGGVAGYGGQDAMRIPRLNWCTRRCCVYRQTPTRRLHSTLVALPELHLKVATPENK